MRYSDDDLLKIVGEERKRSIGFGEGDSGELRAARTRALAYAKGEMNDIPSLPNRSAVVDTTVADAIETVMPDVMEVFIGGEDVATFVPQGEDDEEAAKEETDFINHVVFTENEGFLVLYSAIKDSLLTRTGIIGWWWEEDEKTEAVAEVPEHMAEIAQAMAGMGGDEINAEQREDGSVALSTQRLHGKVCIKAFPSEDFTVAQDTVSLRDATYCAVRSRTRVQDLIVRGIDPEKARELKGYTVRNGEVEQERDQAGENLQTSDEGVGDLRTVEIRDHYIRLAAEDGDKLTIWRVTTDSEEKTFLDSEEVEQIRFAAFTPYIVPHRFHGESVADKLVQVQQIKTVLLRNHMDSIYFALNQRMEVAQDQSNDFTIPDLLRNEPGVPIRVKSAGAIKAVAAGALNVDTLASLEYAATMAESRSGIVRNAQGLNPDTLHDTAKGALALITAAQKRVRMIARIFAETGVKDLFLGVHCLLRKGYGSEGEGKAYAEPSFKRGNAWKQMAPGKFPERCAMTVHVGVGSAGREHDMMIATQRLELMERAANLPGVGQMLLDPSNVYNGLAAWERSAGSRAPELYWSNPEGKPPPPPQPDPKMMEVQGNLALKKEEAAANVQLAGQKAQTDAQTTVQKHQMDAEASERESQRDHERKLQEIQVNGELKRYQVDQELQLKREQLVAELELKRELGMAQAAVAHETGMAKVNASTSQVEPGGDPG